MLHLSLGAGRHRRRRIAWKRPLAVLAVTTLTVAGQALPATSAASNPNDPAGADASVVELGLGQARLGGAGWSSASSESNPGPNRSGVNADALSRNVVLANGLEVPLDDFLDFGQTGALHSESAVTSPYDARAISGALGADGSVTLDRKDGGFSPVDVDLLALFKRTGVSGLSDVLLNEATLRLGLSGAEVIAQNGQFASQYRAGQADLLLTSPAIKQAAASFYDAAGQMDQAAEDRLNEMLETGPFAQGMPDGTSLKAHVTSQMQDQVVAAILARPITSKNDILTVDFSTGRATIHLDQALHGQETVDGPLLPGQDVRPGDPTGLNRQHPNTELIDDELYPMVAESIHDLMDEVATIALGAVERSLDSITVDFTATNSDGSVANWTANLGSDQLSPVVCNPAGPTCDGMAAAVEGSRPAYDGQFAPMRNFLMGDSGDQLFRLAVDDIKTGMITIPVRQALEPIIELAARVFSVQVNHQRTRTCDLPAGGTGVDRLSVSAFSIAVLREANLARLNFGNASARVDACAPTARASVVDSNSGGTPIVGAGYSEAWPGNPGPNRSGTNASIGGQPYALVGDVKVPLEDFVEYGDAAGMQSESTATTPKDARAVTGLVGADGDVEFDNTDGSTFDPAEIDLLALFRRSGVDPAGFVDQATLRLGALASEVVVEGGTFLDPDGVGGPGRYRVGQADLLLHSPSIDEASAMIYDAIGQMDQAAEENLNKALDLSSLTGALPHGTTLKAKVTSEMQEKVFAAILAQPITTRNNLLTVDFATGTATLHLDQFLHGQETVDGPLLPGQDVRPGDPTGLNSQHPNTELIDDEIYPMIAESVHDLMDEVTTIAIGTIERSLASVTVDFTAVLMPSPTDGATAQWSVNLMGSQLNPVSCNPVGWLGGLLCGVLIATANVATPVVNDVLIKGRDFLVGNAGDQLFRLAVDDIKTGVITIPVRQALEPFTESAARVFSVQVNHQERGTCRAPDGSTHLGSLKLSAVSIAVLREENGAQLNFGNSEVHTPC